MVDKRKRELLDIKISMKTKFEPTDIVPLVRYIWPRSVGIVSHAKTAISERGWGPLNYNLLDDAILRRSAASGSTCTAAKLTEIQNDLNRNTVKIDNGIALSILDKLIMTRQNSTAYQHGLTKRMQEMNDTLTKLDQLKKLSRITSGSLGSLSIYHINDDVRNEVKR